MKTQILLLQAVSVLLVGAALGPQFVYALAVETEGKATVTTPTVGASADTGATATTNSSASTNAVAQTQVKVDAKVQSAKDKATKEIDRRIASLQELSARVGNMQRVTANFKQSLSTDTQSQITALSELKAKIDADVDVATLKPDVQSITESYRVYMLAVPRARIAAAADREVTIITMMNQLGAKLQARLSAAQSAGASTTVLMSALADMSKKVTDASTQAQAAVSVTAGLQPDGGDKTKIDQNNAALKTARGDISASQKDLITARKDAQVVIEGLKKLPTPTVSASSSAQTTVQ